MDPFHQRLAQVALEVAAQYGFCLAGGYAVQAHGFVDRPGGRDHQHGGVGRGLAGLPRRFNSRSARSCIRPMRWRTSCARCSGGPRSVITSMSTVCSRTDASQARTCCGWPPTTTPGSPRTSSPRRSPFIDSSDPHRRADSYIGPRTERRYQSCHGALARVRRGSPRLRPPRSGRLHRTHADQHARGSRHGATGPRPRSSPHPRPSQPPATSPSPPG